MQNVCYSNSLPERNALLNHEDFQIKTFTQNANSDFYKLCKKRHLHIMKIETFTHNVKRDLYRKYKQSLLQIQILIETCAHTANKDIYS